MSKLHWNRGQPELVWPGKYDERGERVVERPVARSFRCLEEYGATGELSASRLLWGDNLAAMASLVPSLAGAFDLIYIDPPFATGDSFAMTLAIGEAGVRPKGAATWQETHAYSDRWEGSGFWSMMDARLRLIRILLADTGSLFLHCDHRTDWGLRALLHEIFGEDCINNQIVWHYTGGGRSKRRFSRKHDTIFWVTKGDTWTFNIDEVRVPYDPSSGYARGGIVSAAGKRYTPHSDGKPMDDVWDIPIVNPMSYERVDYPTQKPERLLERILRAASRPGDLVGDFFCGSGTTLAVAEQLGRRWIGCDSSHWAIHTTRKRLLSLVPPASFSLACLEGEHPASRSPGALEIAVVEQAGALRVALEALRWPDEAPLPAPITDAMEHWTDVLDAWAVDVAFQGDHLRPWWQAHRSRRERSLPRLSPPVPVEEVDAIAVRAVDIFGHELEVLLPRSQWKG